MIEEIARQSKHFSYCKKLTRGSDLASDLFQHCLVILMNRNASEIGSPSSYFFRVVWQQWTDKNSSFNKEHRPELIHGFCSDIEKLNVFEDIFDRVKRAEDLRKVEALERVLSRRYRNEQLKKDIKLFRIYLNNPNVSELSRITGIRWNTIAKRINNIKLLIEYELTRIDNPHEFRDLDYME